MSMLALVRVGVASAQTAIDTASAAAGDPDAAVMRVGVLEFLLVHARRLEAGGDDLTLVEAYRAWLEDAVEVYSTGSEELAPRYMRRAGLLAAELELAAARASGALGATASAADV